MPSSSRSRAATARPSATTSSRIPRSRAASSSEQLLRGARTHAVAQEVPARRGPRHARLARAGHGEDVDAVLERLDEDLELSVTVEIRDRRRRGHADAVAVRSLTRQLDVEEQLARVREDHEMPTVLLERVGAEHELGHAVLVEIGHDDLG